MRVHGRVHHHRQGLLAPEGRRQEGGGSLGLFPCKGRAGVASTIALLWSSNGRLQVVFSTQARGMQPLFRRLRAKQPS